MDVSALAPPAKALVHLLTTFSISLVVPPPDDVLLLDELPVEVVPPPRCNTNNMLSNVFCIV